MKQKDVSTPKLAGFQAQIVTLKNQTLRTSYGKNVSERNHIFVAVQDDSGITGFGEGSPLPHFSGERATEMLVVINEVFGPTLLGLDVFDTEAISQSLDQALPHHKASKAALVNAIFDLQGKLAGLPVYQLLGGKVREAIPVAGAVGIGTVDSVLKEVDRLLQFGIRTVKFKVGGDPNHDVKVIRAVRDRFGADLEIRADANAGFGYSDALRFIAGVGDCQLQYFEQPLAPHDVHGLASLRQTSPFPIAVDESLFGLGDAMNLIRHEAADVFILKLIKLGGLHNARKVVALAEAAGLSCVMVSPYETSVGVAANVHLAASSSVFRFAAELGAGVSEVQVSGVEGLHYHDGYVTLPVQPGLGVTLPQDFFGAPILTQTRP